MDVGPILDAPAPPSRRRRLALTALALGVAGAHPLATVLAWYDWRLDVLATFQLPAIAASVLASALLMRLRRVRLAAVLLVMGMLQVGAIAQYALSQPATPGPSRPARLKILIANVLMINREYDRLAALIRRERPDIVGLIEVAPHWIDGLQRAGIRDEYPYRREWPLGVRGSALWFRAGGPVPDFTRDRRPFLVPPLGARFDWQGKSRRLWLVHPPNFLAGAASLAEFQKLAVAVAQEAGSRIVAGDLNRTAGSPHFGAFLRATGLIDSRYGFGEQPSWPTWSPYRIAIDHVFVSPDWAVVSRRLGPDIGSDHFPLIVELAPADPSTNAATQSAQNAP
jgi:endonuclease/exonuclease/phosphatase (EEP) superfamily protein YafD